MSTRENIRLIARTPYSCFELWHLELLVVFFVSSFMLRSLKGLKLM